MTVFVIKIIAVIAMFIDHFGLTFSVVFDTQYLRVIGRIAFPLYIFLIAQGCHYTRNMKKYLLRLGALAVISEIPFDLILSNVGRSAADPIVWYNFGYQNVFFTLFLGVLAVYCYRNFKQAVMPLKIIYGLAGILAVISGDLLHTDYGMIGTLVIFLCACFKNRYQQVSILFVLIVVSYADNLSMFNILMMISGCCSLILISLYNGKEGPKAKWFFYGFYPVHLLLLFGLSCLAN